MEKLTLLGMAGLGIAVFGGALISDASSNTNVNLNRVSPVVRAVPGVIQSTASAASDLLAMAGEPSQENDLSNLLRVGERAYDVAFSNSISSEVVSNATVQKIGYGQESWVSVVTTSSGTYSTDGLASNHVLYPGVVVTELFDDGLLQSNLDHQPKTSPGSIFCVVGLSFVYCN